MPASTTWCVLLREGAERWAVDALWALRIDFLRGNGRGAASACAWSARQTDGVASADVVLSTHAGSTQDAPCRCAHERMC